MSPEFWLDLENRYIQYQLAPTEADKCRLALNFMDYSVPELLQNVPLSAPTSLGDAVESMAAMPQNLIPCSYCKGPGDCFVCGGSGWVTPPNKKRRRCNGERNQVSDMGR